MKKPKNDRWIVLMPIALIVVLGAVLVFLLYNSKMIRTYRNTLCTLTSGPYEMTAEYEGVKVKVRDGNKSKLFTLFSGTDIWKAGKEEPTGEAVHYYFDGETSWIVDIYPIDSKKVLIEVHGEKNFKIYATNNGRFDNYVKIGTPDGWDSINIIIKEEE